MKNKKDELEFIQNPDFDIALEKFFRPEIYVNKNNGTLTKAFAISNEQLPDIFNHLNLTDKKIVTVGSSGDQAFNAILSGCKDCTIIDGNSYAKPLIEYKIALIKTFDFQTFNNLFLNSKMFDWKVYAKISHNLSKTSQQFWDTIMLELSENPNLSEITPNKIPKRMFIYNNDDKHSEFYKKVEIYNKLKDILNKNDIKFNFINAELKEFPTTLTDKYDLIFLSNIYFYYKENIEEFKQIINSLYFNQLNNGGKMVINYEFDTNCDILLKTFAGHKLETLEVTRKFKHTNIQDTVWIINKPLKQINKNDDKFIR